MSTVVSGSWFAVREDGGEAGVSDFAVIVGIARAELKTKH